MVTIIVAARAVVLFFRFTLGHPSDYHTCNLGCWASMYNTVYSCNDLVRHSAIFGAVINMNCYGHINSFGRRDMPLNVTRDISRVLPP